MIVLTTLFFMWGFMTVMNDVLIPHLKVVFTLSYAQSLLIQFCFFGAYGLGSFVYYLYSRGGTDPILKLGYKRASMAGLLISAAGAALFVPATYLHFYGAYLIALFVLGLGFTLLQIAANPFVALVGVPEHAGGRLNLAQGFNSLGTTLAPVIGGALIFQFFAGDQAVRWPYFFFALLLLGQVLWLWLTPLPEPAAIHMENTKVDAWRSPQLRRGMLAIFFYVGAEVSIGSLLISFIGLPQIAGLPPEDADSFLSLYWGGAMIGRFLGSISLGGKGTGLQRTTWMILVALALAALIYAINSGDGHITLHHMMIFFAFVAMNIVLLRIAGKSVGVAMGLFSLAAVLLVTGSVVQSGEAALWSLVAIGLFNSILWSNIFSLSIAGLKEATGQGSSLLVMMIIGGAVIPLLQGGIADTIGGGNGLQLSFLIPAVCYLYLAWFGFIGSRAPTLRS